MADVSGGHRRFGDVFPFLGLAQPGPACFRMQRRLLPADGSQRAIVPDVLRFISPHGSCHDVLLPGHVAFCANARVFFLVRISASSRHRSITSVKSAAFFGRSRKKEWVPPRRRLQSRDAAAVRRLSLATKQRLLFQCAQECSRRLDVGRRNPCVDLSGGLAGGRFAQHQLTILTGRQQFGRLSRLVRGPCKTVLK